jgi:hypothetical protein
LHDDHDDDILTFFAAEDEEINVSSNKVLSSFLLEAIKEG